MNWRKYIVKVGVRTVSEGMGITYAAVRKYVIGNTFPDPGSNTRALIKVMYENLKSSDDFLAFLNSLASEIMGMNTIISSIPSDEDGSEKAA